MVNLGDLNETSSSHDSMIDSNKNWTCYMWMSISVQQQNKVKTGGWHKWWLTCDMWPCGCQMTDHVPIHVCTNIFPWPSVAHFSLWGVLVVPAKCDLTRPGTDVLLQRILCDTERDLQLKSPTETLAQCLGSIHHWPRHASGHTSTHINTCVHMHTHTPYNIVQFTCVLYIYVM